MQATTLDEVIAQLDAIISTSKQQSSRLGYFACLYRKMTMAVKQGITDHLFQDGPRMEKLDVIFANRYLTAYNTFTQNKSVTQAWQVAFEATAKNDYIALQHLLLGINAHINLDLGIAAAEASEGTDINALEKDFNGTRKPDLAGLPAVGVAGTLGFGFSTPSFT